MPVFKKIKKGKKGDVSSGLTCWVCTQFREWTRSVCHHTINPLRPWPVLWLYFM